MILGLIWMRICYLLLVAIIVSTILRDVNGQQLPTCNQARAFAASFLDLQDKCDDAPQCECGYTDEGDYYGRCEDQNVQCSSMDPSVCGTQSTAVVYAVDSTTLEVLTTVVYLWKYTSSRTESLLIALNPDGSCMFTIEQSSGATTDCTCQWTNCNGAASTVDFLQVDCSYYETGAVADECLDGFGVSTGSVLEGMAVTFGGQCTLEGAGSAVNTTAPAPMPTTSFPASPPTSDGEGLTPNQPVVAPTPIKPAPAPAPTSIRATTAPGGRSPTLPPISAAASPLMGAFGPWLGAGVVVLMLVIY